MSTVLRSSLSRIAVVLFVACIAMMVVAPSVVYADESGTSAQGLTLNAQSTNSQFESPDGLVLVDGITAGKVSYNAATKTLTLNGVSADRVGFKKNGTVTLNLVGKNYLAVEDSFDCKQRVTRYEDYGDGDVYEWEETIDKNYDCKGSAIVTGSGTLSGSIDIAGNLTLSKGTLSATGKYDYDSPIICAKLTVKGGTVKASTEGDYSHVKAISCTSVALSKGSISAKGGIECSKNLTVSGGTLSATSEESTAISCAALTVKGGTVKATTKTEYWYSVAVSCTSAALSKGSLAAKGGIECSKNLVMKGGTFSVTKKDGDAISCKNLKMAKGAIKIAKSRTGISCKEIFSMSGGSISIKNPDEGIKVGTNDHKTRTMTLTGGKIAVSSPSEYGLYLRSTNLLMKGGSIAVANSYGSAISLSSDTYRGKTYGGKVKITGGAVTAITRKGKYGYGSAIRADLMVNKTNCLKKIIGLLPKGATFSVGGNEYQVDDYGYDVFLKKYGAKSTEAVVDTVKYGNEKYWVHGVGAGAFNTKEGKKVKRITVKQDLRYIGKNAFTNTNALELLRFNYLPVETKYDRKGNLRAIKWSSYIKVHNTAFAKCGKRGGAGLTIAIRDGLYPHENPNLYKKLLASKGMSNSVKIKTRAY